ncbi:LacI family DNA-binding transcriptional regulator [Pseudarthrobacter sp. YAF2]|uniref:LacI family DNA-binding transcriptional regulator n=1 Tax=Pseudarthrobacter sp. YAF2 TaxID=3233078 RepID=UPI003F9C9FC9
MSTGTGLNDGATSGHGREWYRTTVSRPRRTTIAAVAELAGVSTATVSRVLSGVSPVTETTRERVQAAVEALNYRPSDLTRAVFAGRSNTIGVLFADMRSRYYVGLIEGISRIANASDTLAYLAAGNRDNAQDRRILSLMDSHRVRGLITAAQDNDDIILAMAQSGTECVYITRRPTVDHPRIHSIRLDNVAAGRLAWEHMSNIGRTRPLLVNLSPQRDTTRERTAGFFDAAREVGVELNSGNTFGLSSLDKVSDELVERIRDGFASGAIDSVVATTGVATFRAYEALTRTGLHVPDDVAILGFDDFDWAEYLSTPLTVISQPTVEMGSAAAELILTEPGTSQQLTFPPQLIVRESTRGRQKSPFPQAKLNDSGKADPA